MADNIAIRRAGVKDADAFGRFLRDAWAGAGPDAPGFAGATDEIIDEMTQHDAMVATITDSDRCTFLAHSPAGVVGFAATRRIDAERIELAGIIVASDVVGLGIGRSLVDRCLATAAETGFEIMIVRTEVTNETAQRFYQRLGFTETAATTEDVDGTSVPVVELTQQIA